MKLIFIIDSCEKLLNEYTFELIKKSRGADLLFIRKNEYIKDLLFELPGVSLIDISDDYYELLDRSRDGIIKFFAGLPARSFKIKEGVHTSFHGLFQDKGFSAWWLMNFADKAPDSGGIINRLFQLDIIKSLIEKTKYDLGLIHSGDGRFAESVINLFASRKISSARDNELKTSGKRSFPVLKTVKPALKLAASKILTELLSRISNFMIPGFRNSAVICFHSWFPAHWVDLDGKYLDKYYFDLIDHIKDNSSVMKPSYLFKLKCFDWGLTEISGRLERIFKTKVPFDFLDRYVAVADILNYYGLAAVSLSDLDVIFSIGENKRIFEYNGIDIFAMAYFEFRNSFLFDMPYNLILSKALKRYLRKNKNVKVFVNFLELYAYARGFINEIKSDPELSGIKTIAFQHSTITKYNLHYNYDKTEIRPDSQSRSRYLPEPDGFLLSGKNAVNTIETCKISPEKFNVTGSPRYDFILDFFNRAPKDRDGKFLKVLIATVSCLEESLDILKLSLESLSLYENISISIKMHPMRPIENEIISIFEACEKYKNMKYEIKKDNIYDLIVNNDILITSNSMVGLEALVLGSGVVLYGDPFKINLSPLADSLEFRDRICYSNKKFKETVDKAVSGKLEKPSPEAVNKLIEDNYYKLDGRANERILKVLEGLIDGGN